MSSTQYSAAEARAAADLVRTRWPCQGVTVYSHPTVDRWVRIRFSPTGEWHNMAATQALERTQVMRAKQRTARMNKREGAHAG